MPKDTDVAGSGANGSFRDAVALPFAGVPLQELNSLHTPTN